MKVPSRLVPMSLRSASWAGLPRDVLAGLTVWAVLVPEALAYATIAGVPPVVGLYAAPAALVLYALLGSSRHLVVGPMAAASALSGAAVAAVAADATDAVTLTAVLAVAVGVFGLIAAALRLGFVASFISEPVLKGFIIGLALTIIAGQAPKLFGIEGAPGEFFERVWHLVSHLGDTHVPSLAVGAGSLVALLALHRLAPRLPGPLIVVAGAVAAAKVFDLAGRGVAVVGPIDSGLPPLGLPDAGLSEYGTLAGSAVAILLVGFAEGLAGAKTYAAKARYRVDANRELLGVGAANVGAGLSSGMVVAGSLSKTAVNGSAGARSQVSGLVVGGVTVLTLLFLTGLFEDLPEPTLGAVVVAAVVGLVDLGALVRLSRLTSRDLARIYGHAARADLIAALAALGGVLVFDTLPGLFIGIGVSVVLLVHRSSRAHVAKLGRLAEDRGWADAARHPGAEEAPGVVVVRPEGGLVYVNAEAVHDAVLAAVGPGVHGVVVDLETVPVIDVTAAEMLVELRRDLADLGVTLALARDVGQVRDLLRASDAADLLDVHHRTIDDAVAHLGAPTPPTGGDR